MLDKTFRISLVLKALDGLLETIGGLLLLFISPKNIASIARTLTENELSHDPHDFIATHILHAAKATTTAGALFGAIYLIAHGLVKIVLVVAVLKNKLWAYPWMIGFLLIFIAYQIYRIDDKFSLGLLLLTLFDGFIVVLTAIEYRRHIHVAEPKDTD